MEKNYITLSIIFVLLVLAGCSTNNSTDEVERTYPEAFTLEVTTIRQLRDEVVPPDSLNIDVFVVGSIGCPPNALCVSADGIFLSESRNPPSSEENFFLAARTPGQFKEGQEYVISVAKRINDNGTRTFFDLLGYSLVPI